VGRILYFLKLQLDVSWEEEKLSAYRDKQLVRLGPLYQDEYLDVRLYAVENRRPKNRYTLVAIGRCTFRGSGYDDRRGDILELPYTYGCDVNCHGSRANIIQEFIHLPTIDDIKKFAEKRNSLMKAFLAKYQEVKREYLEILRTYRLEEFTGIEASSG